MKRKLGFMWIFVLIILLGASMLGFAQQNIKVKVNGEMVEFPVAPIIEENRILVPIRGVFEKLGAEVLWDQKTSTVSIKDKYMNIELTIGNEKVYIHRFYDFTGIPQAVNLEVPAKVINQTTFVPVRFASEALGAKVTWDSESYTVNIDTKNVGEENELQPVELLSFERISKEAVKNNKNLTQWVETNYKKAGIHSILENNVYYVLVSGGEKRTGGYAVEVQDVNLVKPETAIVTYQVHGPKPGAMVTQAITYPYALIKFDAGKITDIQGHEASDSQPILRK